MSSKGFWTRFLLPGGLWLTLLFLIPVGFVLALSFGYVDDLGRAVYAFELDNYADAFDPTYLPVLLRSVGFAVATAALCLLLGYPIAYYIARYGGEQQAPADRAAGDPVLRQLPRPHLRLGRAARRRRARQQRPRRASG